MVRQALIGSKLVAFPGQELLELEDSAGANDESLRERFERDGYLFVRGLLPRQSVLDARERVVSWREEDSSIKKLRERARRDECITEVVEHRALFELTSKIVGAPTMTFAFKWLRAVGSRAGTGAHCDSVYMGRGSQNVCTVWIPFGDVRVEQGTLTVCEASHRLEAFRRIHQMYGQLDVDRDCVADTGWFTDEPLELDGQWRTADFAAGDVVLFGLRTLHAATSNLGDDLRISCDVRFQSEHEDADERWIGDEPVGHTTFGISGPASTTVAELRRKWGL